MRPLLSIAGLALLVACIDLPLAAQRGAGPGGQQAENSRASSARDAPVEAQAGAGTTNGTTTSTSHPMREGGKDGGSDGSPPPLPEASLCDAYDGDVRSHCLETVLREGAQSAPAKPTVSAASPATEEQP